MTPAALATTAGRMFVTNGANSIAEREFLDHVVETSETTTSTSFTSLATNGPVVTLTTGPRAFVCLSVMQSNSTAGIGCWTSFEISGATTTAVIDNRGIYHQNDATWDSRIGVATLISTTPGVNTFRMLYRVIGNTGTFRMRRLQVMAL